MTFDEVKKSWSERFGRTLTDKEIAEIALNQLSDSETERQSLYKDYEEAQKEIHVLRSNLSERIPASMLKQCDEILSVPAERHCITLNFGCDRIPSLDYSVDGIMFNEGVSE